MEWVETTAKTVAEARDQALDRLGVAEEDAEIEVLEEPRAGLFGRMRGEARVRVRIRPTAVRPKQDRRAKGRARGKEREPAPAGAATVPAAPDDAEGNQPRTESRPPSDSDAPRRNSRQRQRSQQRKERPAVSEQDEMSDQDDRGVEPTDTDPAAVGQAAVEFMTGLVTAFGGTATATLHVEGNELDVRIDGDELGLLIGPGGRTLLAVQDLARVASQRRLGDHETRLRIDVAGYRERRRAALEKFAAAVANEVVTSGRGKALEPMPSADRKIVHDAIQGMDGVTSHSDGEEPRRRVVITPA